MAALLADSQQSQLFAKALGVASPRRDALSPKDADGHPIQLEGEAAIINNETIISRSWADPNPVKTDTIFRDMIEGVVNGSVLVPDAICRAEESLRNLTS